MRSQRSIKSTVRMAIVMTIAFFMASGESIFVLSSTCYSLLFHVLLNPLSLSSSWPLSLVLLHLSESDERFAKSNIKLIVVLNLLSNELYRCTIKLVKFYSITNLFDLIELVWTALLLLSLIVLSSVRSPDAQHNKMHSTIISLLVARFPSFSSFFYFFLRSSVNRSDGRTTRQLSSGRTG